MGLFFVGLLVFCLWMVIDCMQQPVKDKIFWAILMLVTGPIGAILYAINRDKLLVRVHTTPEGTITVPIGDTSSATSQVIKGIGMAIGVVLALAGLLIVGFIVLFITSFQSASSGSSK
jgi:hypothetical protein